MKSHSVQSMCACALLIAVGTAIPMFMPIKVVLEPMSFTLASHVAIFIAMMISPSAALAVAVGTTGGFFLAGFPPIVVLRAASHVVFALAGSLYLRRFPATTESLLPSQLFSLAIGLIHGVCEMLVVAWFYVGGSVGELYYQQGFFRSVFLLVGFGSVVHSMVDFGLALAVAGALKKQKSLGTLLRHA